MADTSWVRNMWPSVCALSSGTSSVMHTKALVSTKTGDMREQIVSPADELRRFYVATPNIRVKVVHKSGYKVVQNTGCQQSDMARRRARGFL